MKLKLLFVGIILCIYSQSTAQIANQPPNIQVCEDVDNSWEVTGFATFDLTINEDIITDGNTTSVFVRYFETQEDANNFTNSIVAPWDYESNSTTIYVRVSESGTANFATTSFFIQVLEPPFASDTEHIVCDEDGVSDGITTLNTEEINTWPSDIDAIFYFTEEDAENETNAIPQFFQNLVPNNDIIYYRINEGICYDIASVYLNINTFPDVDPITPYEVCEANSDGIALFYLDSKIPEISQNGDYFITFYETLELAENGSFNDRLPSEYENISNPQTIYARVFNTGGCVSIFPFDLVVNDAITPEINTIPTQSFCPTELGPVDLTTYEAQLVDDASNLTITYYTDVLELISATNPIADPTNFPLTLEPIEVFIRIDDDLSECYSITSIDFNFNAPCEVSCSEAFDVTFCQPANDMFFTFSSVDGSPLTLEIVEGTIYTFGSNSGYIIVKDSDGTELYNGSGTPTATNHISDLAGLVFQSTGSLLTFEFYSDLNRCDQDPEINIPLDINVYCSEDVGLIQLSAFLDENTNGVFDNTESNYTRGTFIYEKNGDGNEVQITSSTGEGTIVSNNASDTYEIAYELFPDNENCFDITTASFSNISVDTGNTISVDFPVTEIISCEDLSLNLINSQEPPRPGFTYKNFIILANEGTSDIASGTIEFVRDPFLQSLIVNTNNPGYSTVNTGTGFTLNFTNLQAGSEALIEVVMTCSPSVDLGTIVENTVSYITDGNDANSDNNSSSLSEEVIGSYDPNDKMESHGPRIIYDDFLNSDEWLYYTIRFQNLGTADAIFIRIEDELNAQLDEDTFQMIRSSHDYTVTRTGTSLEWFFDQIFLPAEQDDEEGSHGYVYFKIKPKSGYAIGDIIPNTASIYFDFNEAVVTNMYESEFVEDPLSINEFSALDFSFYPNPASTILNLEFSTEDHKSIDIIDIQGKRVLSNTTNLRSKKINISQLEKGMYFLQVTANTNRITRKLILE
ncbi:T9SS type A sorting domain-containing protein [Ichthyenterobacterium sp. W332]|uniref:T9SS type A sorting domain-containing protein n=1 Tax=Microcosmobacter mediterraneus TaxID=3075607 RepID=A0ABU2YHB3_9FLAO|nr:T9SS type A sorting domain-containing protein [Ichthyenterobacterium sp. W332]MDT0557559.1 T9SS type A sorting domain-containing protein [Ichthyenterobacterium sp. W332]